MLLHHIVLPMPEHFTSIHSVPPRRPPPRSPSAEHAGPCFPRVDCLLILNLRQVVKIRVQLTRRGDLQYHSLKRNLGLDFSSPYLLSLPPSPSNSLLPVSRTTTPAPRMSRCGRRWSSLFKLSLCSIGCEKLRDVRHVPPSSPGNPFTHFRPRSLG